nr:prepilin-type N-terminal cleavage/methylation domain-containing protein [bacterium]
SSFKNELRFSSFSFCCFDYVMNLSEKSFTRTLGFTLIELVIVITIIGVIVSITPILISNYLSNQDLEIDSNNLISSIRFLQSSPNQNSEITFDIAQKTYSLTSSSGSESVRLQNNIFFYQAPSKIVFNKKGISLNMNGDTIILSNGSKKKIISVKPITGDVELISQN